MGNHYNPRWLLRKFEDQTRPGFIWQHDKKYPERPPVQAAISQVAQERNFYDPETEIRLNTDVEIPGSRAIQKLLDKEPITFDERVDVAVYVGAMLQRVPFFREWATEFFKEAYPKALNDTREHGRQLIESLATENNHNDEWVAERLSMIDKAFRKFSIETPKSIIDRLYSPFPSEAIVRSLLDMTWRIVETSGPQFFITSDNPAHYFRWRGYGLMGPETELALPLSKTVALHGSRQRARSSTVHRKAAQRTVREINKRLVSQTTRFVFTHDRAFWLKKILSRNDLGVMRLGW